MTRTAAQVPPRPKGVWKGDLAAVARPIVVYHVWVASMMALFCAVFIVADGVKAGTVLVLGTLAVSTVVGIAIGQALAILRLRGCALVSLWAAWWGMSTVLGVGIASAGGGDAAIILGIVLFFMPFWVAGGVWSVATHRALPAAWIPIVYGIGACVVIIEEKGKLHIWEHGSKWAIWDVGTTAILGLCVTLLFVYLLSRERHRLHHWRNAPRALLAGTVIESGKARPRLTWAGWLLLLCATLMLTGATAVIAPYLWRTGPAPQGDHDGGDGGEPQPRAHERDGSDFGDRLGRVLEQASQAAKQATALLCPLLIGLLVLGVLGAAAWRPARRTLLVHHLRTPLWPVPPTTRIENGWRLIEIVLGDLGVERRASESAADYCDRATPRVKALADDLLPTLRKAAAIRDRVTYALGVGPDDLTTFIDAAEWVYANVSNRLRSGEKVTRLFRRV